MHSTIFQITTEMIEEGGLLDEDTLHQGDYSELDYCVNVDNEERRKRIETLVNKILPEGMSTLIDENTIRYNGGVEEWQEKWVMRIKELCSHLTAINIQEWTTLYYLKEAIDNPLDTGIRFYDDNYGCSSYSEKSGKFLYTSVTALIVSKIYRLRCTNSVLWGKMAASRSKWI